MVLYNVRANLNETFAALADPTRRAILARLACGEAGVMELAKPFRISQPAVSKHLKVLERAAAPGAVVLPAGFHHDREQRGAARGWRILRLHALAGGERSPAARRVSRDRATGAAGVHARLDRCQRRTRARDDRDRYAC